jgi:anti-anti-sigma regulatory factor
MNIDVISVDRDSTAIRLKICGDAGVENATELRQRLLATEISGDLVVDWEAAERVHTSVLQVLLSFSKTLKPGCSVRVEKDNPQLREYLELSGLSDFFPLRQAPPPAEPRNPDNG